MIHQIPDAALARHIAVVGETGLAVPVRRGVDAEERLRWKLGPTPSAAALMAQGHG